MGNRQKKEEAAARKAAGEIPRFIGIQLSNEDADAVGSYAQHMGITPTAAVRELMRLGLASDPMSAAITAARATAHNEMRAYVMRRFQAAFKEIGMDLEGLIKGDVNARIPPGYGEG